MKIPLVQEFARQAAALPTPLLVFFDRDDVAGVDVDHLVPAGQLQVDDRDRAAADADDFFVGFLGADLDLELLFGAGADGRHTPSLPGGGAAQPRRLRARRRTAGPGYRRSMKALILNCTLKPSPATSNTEALAAVVAEKLRAEDVE